MHNGRERWLKVAANLRVDRTRGVAPHKPLLLLVVAGLAEEGKLAQPVLPLRGGRHNNGRISHKRAQRAQRSLRSLLSFAANPLGIRHSTIRTRHFHDFFTCLHDRNSLAHFA
jgi:hypothetical protein